VILQAFRHGWATDPRTFSMVGTQIIRSTLVSLISGNSFDGHSCSNERQKKNAAYDIIAVVASCFLRGRLQA
jgi:hypothetical protein